MFNAAERLRERRLRKEPIQPLTSGDRWKEVCGEGQIKDASQSKGALYKDSRAGTGRVQNSWTQVKMLTLERGETILSPRPERRKGQKNMQRHRVKGGHRGPSSI